MVTAAWIAMTLAPSPVPQAAQDATSSGQADRGHRSPEDAAARSPAPLPGITLSDTEE